MMEIKRAVQLVLDECKSDMEQFDWSKRERANCASMIDVEFRRLYLSMIGYGHERISEASIRERAICVAATALRFLVEKCDDEERSTDDKKVA